MCARYPHQHHVQHSFHLINNTSHQIGPLKCQRRDPFVLQVSKEQPRTVTTPQETIYCKKCLFPCEAAPHWVVFNHVTGEVPSLLQTTRKIHACPCSTWWMYVSRSASHISRPSLERKRTRIFYMNIHMFPDANPSLFGLHLALEEAESLPRGVCLMLALNVQVPSLRCPYLRGLISSSNTCFVLEVLIPSSGSPFRSYFPH